tara:strand:- start:334 stop:669 length:336 start_codon:yes stop_codon:yes gene_type:complete
VVVVVATHQSGELAILQGVAKIHRQAHLALAEQFHLAHLQGEEVTHRSGELALLQGVAKIQRWAYLALVEQFHLAHLQGEAKIHPQAHLARSTADQKSDRRGSPAGVKRIP